METKELLEKFKIINSIPLLGKIDHKKIIKKYGEAFMIELVLNKIDCTDITLDETMKLFIKHKLIKKSWIIKIPNTK